MQELVGRITALDPEASETLKIVSYFDALVANDVGIESLLRSAAALSGTSVCFRRRDRTIRIGSDGARIAPPESDEPGQHSKAVGVDSVVWIERTGSPRVNDAMVLERLAIALALTTARRTGDKAGSVELAISRHATDEERGTALARLRLTDQPLLRVVALQHDAPAPARAPSAVVVTSHGLARAVILPPGERVEPPGRKGLGTLVPADRLAESWAAALIALRLTTIDSPEADAEQLGALILLAEAADARAITHPDVDALRELDARSRELLDALVESDSIRAAALRLGRHHSTVQERAASLTAMLGYDARTANGRMRYEIARLLLRLSVTGL